MPVSWPDRYAPHAQSVQSSAIRELLKLTQNPEVISFGGGLPAPELFPVAELQAACDRILSREKAASLQYHLTEGYPPLRDWIARWMSTDGLRLGPENILVTTGSQQSLDLTGKLLLREGDRVAVEDPTFLGALQAFHSREPVYSAIPVDNDGLQTGRLSAAFAAGAKFLYTMPTFQNPGGVTLTAARRAELLEIADREGVPVVEDDPYSALRFEGKPLPSLLAMDAARNHAEDGLPSGNVVYFGSFSKTVAPGLRLSWIAAPPEVIAKLAQLKQGADLHTSIFVQMVVYETVRDGFLPGHVERIRAAYRERRDAMLAALEECFPPGVTWTRPQGGLFLWVTLPEGIVSGNLLREALARKVAFVPGNGFFANDPHKGDRFFRLNYSNMGIERIGEGIHRLGQAIREFSAQLPGLG